MRSFDLSLGFGLGFVMWGINERRMMVRPDLALLSMSGMSLSSMSPRVG